MFPPRTAIRSIVACTLACGLLATTTSSAAARPMDDARGDVPTSSLAGTTSTTPRQDLRSPDARDAAREAGSGDATVVAKADPWNRYYESVRDRLPVAPFYPSPQDLRSPDARDAANAEQIARATEGYYQSFNKPVPTAPFASTAPASPSAGDSPWLLVSVMAGGLALVLASTALVLRRRRVAV